MMLNNAITTERANFQISTAEEVKKEASIVSVLAKAFNEKLRQAIFEAEQGSRANHFSQIHQLELQTGKRDIGYFQPFKLSKSRIPETIDENPIKVLNKSSSQPLFHPR